MGVVVVTGSDGLGTNKDQEQIESICLKDILREIWPLQAILTFAFSIMMYVKKNNDPWWRPRRIVSRG